MDFTKDELSLISIYNTGDREGTIEEITEMRTYLEDDETDLAELTVSVLLTSAGTACQSATSLPSNAVPK